MLLCWSHHCLNLTLKFTSTVAWPLWALQSVNGFGKQTHTLIHTKTLLLLLFSRSVISDSLWPHGLHHTRLPCPSPSPRVYSNSCPLSSWCHPTISSSVVAFSSCLQPFPASESFSNESALHIRWPKYWSFNFSINPSSEYSGLISFRIGLVWFPCSPRDSQESSPPAQFNHLAIRFLCGPTLTSTHDYWKNHSFDYMDFCWQSNVSAF